MTHPASLQKSEVWNFICLYKAVKRKKRNGINVLCLEGPQKPTRKNWTPRTCIKQWKEKIYYCVIYRGFSKNQKFGTVCTCACIKQRREKKMEYDRPRPTAQRKRWLIKTWWRIEAFLIYEMNIQHCDNCWPVEWSIHRIMNILYKPLYGNLRKRS